ncbi:MAG TPA: hypothetical protein VF465_21120, partial [Flavobacterium sp.]
MKTLNYILVLLIAFSSTMCNSSKKDKEEIISTETISKTEKHQHKTLSPNDSLKLVNHQIEIKGDIEFPLQLTVDSLRKMKVVVIDNFKIMGKNGEIKKEIKTCKGVLLRDILEKAK